MKKDLLNTLLNVKAEFKAATDRLSTLQKLSKPLNISREITIIGGLLVQALDSAKQIGDEKLTQTIADAAYTFSHFIETFESGRSYLNELDFLDKIERAADRVSVKTLNGNITFRPPVGDIAGLIYEKLKSLPEHKGMTCPKLNQWLTKEHKIIMDDSTLRKNHLKQLEPFGCRLKKRIGYYIQ